MAVWWVNQGESYRQEDEAGILWAPHLSSVGRRLSHWESMTHLALGDTVWHYANGQLKAVGPVLVRSVDAQRPPDLPASLWGVDGRLARVEYHESTAPPARDDIP